MVTLYCGDDPKDYKLKDTVSIKNASTNDFFTREKFLSNPSKSYECSSKKFREKVEFGILKCVGIESLAGYGNSVLISRYMPYECDTTGPIYYFECELIEKKEDTLKINCGENNKYVRKKKKFKLKFNQN